MSTSDTLAYFDVDTQRDFMVATGALYVPRARTIAANIRRLVAHAGAKGIRLFSSADAHAPDDPEFDTFPAHCVVGTPGQEKIRGTLLRDRIAVRVEPKLSKRGIDAALGHQQIIIEKPTYNVFDNPHTKRLLRASGATRFVVFGVATDYCVLAAALGLLKLGHAVTIATDAIRGITIHDSAAAFGQMLDAGARFQKTDQLLA